MDRASEDSLHTGQADTGADRDVEHAECGKDDEAKKFRERNGLKMDTRPFDFCDGLSRVIAVTIALPVEIICKNIKCSFAADPS